MDAIHGLAEKAQLSAVAAKARRRICVDEMETRLVCIECGADAEEDGERSRSLIADDPRDDVPAYAAVCCAACAAREFGPAGFGPMMSR